MAPVIAPDGDGPLCDELTRLGLDVHRSGMSSWRAYTRIFRRYADAHRLLKIASGRDICVVHMVTKTADLYDRLAEVSAL